MRVGAEPCDGFGALPRKVAHAEQIAEEWSAETESAFLIATPAGRRMYESIRFVAVDEILTRYCGLEADVLDAIG